MGRTRQLGHSRPGASVPARRWPWWLMATLAGALVGAAVAVAVRRVRGQDGPDAVEPDQVEAVVDRPEDPTGSS